MVEVEAGSGGAAIHMHTSQPLSSTLVPQSIGTQDEWSSRLQSHAVPATAGLAEAGSGGAGLRRGRGARRAQQVQQQAQSVGEHARRHGRQLLLERAEGRPLVRRVPPACSHYLPIASWGDEDCLTIFNMSK